MVCATSIALTKMGLNKHSSFLWDGHFYFLVSFFYILFALIACLFCLMTFFPSVEGQIERISFYYC